MECFYSTADMLEQMENKGWLRHSSGRGFRLIPPPEVASGFMEIWGDPNSHCFIQADIIFHVEQMERYYFRTRGIQITFIEEMALTYYQNKMATESSRFGTYCNVNNHPRPWYKHFQANSIQKGQTLVVTEDFFKQAGILITDDQWNQAASFINNRNISMPALAGICRAIKYTPLYDPIYPIFFHGKIVEAASLVLNEAFLADQKLNPPITKKAETAARKAWKIVNQDYVNPPVIDHLAQELGVNKKTLQRAFYQIVGQTINDYISSLKMEKALILLTETSLTIEEIALEIGYLSKANFYKAFKKNFGCTPNEMRHY